LYQVVLYKLLKRAAGYILEVIAAEVDDVRITVRLRVVTGPEAGRTTKCVLWFTDRMFGIAVTQLTGGNLRGYDGFGLTNDDIRACDDLHDLADLLIGRVIEVPHFTSREHKWRTYPMWPMGESRYLASVK
jgi:hypothetical protein